MHKFNHTDRVAWSLGRYRRSVGRSVGHTSEPCKTAEMPFGLRTRVGQGNNVLDEGPDPQREGAILRGEGGVLL